MAESELSELVASRSEDLSIEYKAWLDTSDPAARAKLARHIAALCNHGGGYLVFGIYDGTRAPMGETPLVHARRNRRHRSEVSRSAAGNPGRGSRTRRGPISSGNRALSRLAASQLPDVPLRPTCFCFNIRRTSDGRSRYYSAQSASGLWAPVSHF